METISRKEKTEYSVMNIKNIKTHKWQDSCGSLHN